MNTPLQSNKVLIKVKQCVCGGGGGKYTPVIAAYCSDV